MYMQYYIFESRERHAHELRCRQHHTGYGAQSVIPYILEILKSRHACVNIYVYIYIYICVCVYTYIYVHTILMFRNPPA